MDIKYLGHSSFFLKGKSGSVVTDPYDPEKVGLKFPRNVQADVVTVSHDHDDHNAAGNVGGSPFVVRGPGEYEIKGIGVVGIPSYHDAEDGKSRGKNTIYRIELDGVVVVHVGDLGHELSTKDVEILDGVGVLMIPVGGHYTIDPATAKRIVNEIEPSIVIPMHYRRPELPAEAFGMLAEVNAFLKEMDADSVVPQPKLSVSKDRLPEEMQVVVLS